MAQAKKRRAVKQHRLLVYQKLGARMRVAPFLIGAMSLLLFGLGWLSTQDVLTGVDTSLFQLLWDNNVYLIIIMFVCGVIFVYGLVTGALSYVEAQAKFLHIQAGLIAINISYRRLRQIRLSQVGVQYPEKSLRGNDINIAGPLLALPCTLLDLSSWPWPGYKWLRRLWGKFLFSGDGVALMLVVPDAMVLNQQIDGRLSMIQAQGKQTEYMDPLERAAQAQKQGGTRR
jgi:hypothetical protein